MPASSVLQSVRITALDFLIRRDRRQPRPVQAAGIAIGARSIPPYGREPLVDSPRMMVPPSDVDHVMRRLHPESSRALSGTCPGDVGITTLTFHAPCNSNSPAVLDAPTAAGYCSFMETFDVVAGIAAVVGACTGLVSAVGVLVVNGKVDRLTGRVDELSRAFNSHVNASH